MAEPAPHQLRCVVVSPEKALLDEAADAVVLPMYDGELGVLPGRAPLIGRLGYGELRLRHGATVRRFYVDGGFAQVRANTVTVLTARAMRVEDIKPDAVRHALDAARAAQVKATTDEDQDANLLAMQRARTQLRLAARTEGRPGGEHGHA